MIVFIVWRTYNFGKIVCKTVCGIEPTKEEAWKVVEDECNEKIFAFDNPIIDSISIDEKSVTIRYKDPKLSTAEVLYKINMYKVVPQKGLSSIHDF